MRSDCIFCSIVCGRAPAHIVYADEGTIAFLDVNPCVSGHTLVIPRRHAENIFEIETDDLTRTFVIAQRLAGRMRERLGCDQVTIWNSNGAAAGQTIPHFHIHVIPAGMEAVDQLLRGDTRSVSSAQLGALANQLRCDAPATLKGPT
jgi:histidine triad (HIT) family protein